MKRMFFVVLILECLVFTGCPKKALPPIIPIIGDGFQSYKDTLLIINEPFNFKPIYFEYNKFGINGDAQVTLESNAQELMKSTNSVRLEGYCDERGTEQYNLSLGQKRSESVKDFLVSYGINANRITVISYGEERQICSESTEACWGKNRYVKFVVSE